MTPPGQRVHSGRPKPVTAARHNRVLRAAERRALDLEDHLVGLLVPVLEDAGDLAARNFQERASTHLSASLTQDMTASADQVVSTSTMVAVKPRAAEAQALAQDGEHPAEKLHVTLAYLGRTEGPLERVAEALAQVAATHAPLEGVVGGAGVFADQGEGHPSILLPDVPGLLELRHHVTEALTGAGVDYGRDHGFTAHVTVGYRPDPNAPPVELMGQPLHFDDLLVVRGDTEVVPIPLTGAKPLTASTWEDGAWAVEDDHAAALEADVADVAEQHQPDGGYGDTYWDEAEGRVFWICADWTSIDEIDDAVAAFMEIDGVEDVEVCDECGPPEGDAYVRVYPASLTAAAIDDLDFCLPLQLRGKTDPVRQAVVQSVGIAGVEGTGIAFDVTNPHAGRVLSRAASQVTHISKTTQLDVMKVVNAAYEDGLSIPDTAKAIQAAMKVSAPVRARLIARTELAGAVNGASLAATQIVSDATDAQYQKTWLTAPGAKYPRHDDYEGLDRQTVGLDEYFDVGGSALQFPGDPNGPPDEVCNCRCTMIYAEPGGGVGEIDAESGGLAASICHAHDPSRAFLETWFDNEVATIVWGLVAAGSSSGPADWVAPSAEEILPVGCDRPGASLTPDTHPTAPIPRGDTVSVPAAPYVSQAAQDKIAELNLNTWPPTKGQVAERILGDATDTTALYKIGDDWQVERAKVQDAIIREHFEGKTPGEVKHAWFTAGGSASGKSGLRFDVGGKELSLTELEAREDVIYVDPDRIKEMLPEYQQMRDAGDAYAASGVHEESSEIAKAVVREARERGFSFVLDTTGSSSGFVAKIQAVAAESYETSVSMVSVPTNEAIMRAVSRGDRSGRYVAIPSLKHAHAGASRQLGVWMHDPSVQAWRLYDNSGRGGSPTLVAEGGGGKTTRVYEQAKLDAILAKGAE